ncbi:uncharacterized protein [Nicotiana tomentosiformis]|uniref:uncharacterized protein n=1 Tax=Nicotiana tomentosiformis TaxID=4098 RepID=UPI00388CE8D4
MKAEKKKKEEENLRREVPEESKYMSAIPFPQKQSREKLDKQFGRFLDVLKQVHVNLPFTEVLSQMPDYATFLKEILMKKRTMHFDKSLCDSGASINLMPLSIYRKQEKEIGEKRSALISLQLADQTTIIPEGIVEDILVRVDKLVFPVNFIVVNMEENKEVPLILGRPFLTTGRTILDIHERKLMLRVGEETVTFKMDIEKGAQKDKPAASVEWKVKGLKEKAMVREKDKCGVYPK